MKDTHEIAVLRTMLKNVNVEHSAVLRSGGPEEKLARIVELKRQRLALMSRIAGLRQRRSRLEAPADVARPAPLDAALGREMHAGVLATVGVAVASAAVTLQRYWAGWARGGTADRRAV
jgi:hypothetical protein